MGKACSKPSAESGDVAEGVAELTYFDGPGRAELTRLAFKAGAVEFKDNRIAQEAWPALKADSTKPPAQAFGSMPVVKRGQFLLAQSMATAQYAADLGINKRNPSPQQRATDYMILGAQGDIASAMYKCLFGDDASKAKGKEELSGKVTPVLQGVERQFKVGPFLYNTKEEGPSLGDLSVYNFVTSPFPGLKALEFDLAPFAKITACVDAVEAALASVDAQKPAATSKGPQVTGKPELIYFGGPGRAQLTRLLFAAGDVDYTDTHVEQGDWPAIKSNPDSAQAKMFGSMPVITHGDFSLAQSQACAQYAADLGIYTNTPPTPEQRALDAMMMGAHADMQTAMYACLFGSDESKAAGMTDLAGKVTPILEGIERFYKSDETCFLFAPEVIGPSVGDIAILDAVISPFPGLLALGFDMSPFAKIQKMIDMCRSSSARPGLKAYLEKVSPKKKTVCITGAGNAAHVFIPYFSNLGYDVTVFANFKDEAERLQKGVDENGGIMIHDRQDPSNIKEYKGKPSKISKDAADVVPQADYIIAALPSFAIKPTLDSIKTHLKQDSIIFIMPGQGGADFVAKACLKDQLASGTTTMAGVVPMPLNCRITDWGKRVELAALKETYDLATVPAKNVEVAAKAFSELMNKPCQAIGNYIGIGLHCSNPNLHPGRLYRMWSGYAEGTVYPENPLFYETWDDESTEWLMKINDERLKIWKTILDKYPDTGKVEQVPHMFPHIKSIYGPQVKDPSTFTSAIRTCDGYKGFKCPMKEVDGGWVPDFENRYFTEDIPEGVAMYKGIADLAGFETPAIDEIVCFFQKFMGKEYIKDGKLAGANVSETKSPQAFGVTSLEQLLQD